MKILYKYRNFNEYTDNIILNSSLYFSAIEKFNDPFDCKLSFRQEYSLDEMTSHVEQMEDNFPDKFNLEDLKKQYPDNKCFADSRNRITNKLINRIGVLSLSTNPKNILMWSHYSKNHTGLIFQFTFTESSTCFCPYYPVDYKNKYDLLSYTSCFREEAIKLMLTKHTDWRYESEIRMIDLDFQGEKGFKKHELTSIIFGAFAKNDDIDRMMDLCKKNGFEHVKFSKARLTSGEFSLEFREILNSASDAKS